MGLLIKRIQTLVAVIAILIGADVSFAEQLTDRFSIDHILKLNKVRDIKLLELGTNSNIVDK